jgi:hypothetical protein
MKTITSIRIKSEVSTREQFVRGSEGTIQTKIINTLNKNPHGNYQFLINEDGEKYVQSMQDLMGEVVNVVNDSCIAEFTEDEEGNPIVLLSQFESLPQQNTVDQLKMVRKLSKGTDIGDKISNMNKQGANIQYIRNPIDTGIESTQDYERSNKKFEPNWNLKRIKPYKTYFLDQTTSDRLSHKKRKGKKKND